MNIREAILKAADHIERNPRDFNFDHAGIPDSCGSPGCAIGWIAYFADVMAKDSMLDEPPVTRICPELLGVGEGEFYTRMNNLGGLVWIDSGPQCASALRMYARKYHPTPNWSAMAASQTVAADAVSEDARCT
jgi:hypothetical protein